LGTKPGNPQTNTIISTGPFGEFSRDLLSPNTPILMMGDNGMVVGRMGSSATSPIRLFSQDLASHTDIATSASFSALGQNPGISDSGEMVAFYGNRISDGPGIFLYFVSQQELVRIASQRTNASPDDPNIVAGFSPDVRVSVNNEGVVIFQGLNAGGQAAVFRTVARHCNNQVVSLPAKQVVAVGDAIPGLAGTVQSIAINDSLNNNGSGDIAFLATMPGGIQAIVKATPKQCDVCSVCKNPGGVQATLGSVRLSIGLGPSMDASVSGSLNLYSDIPASTLSTPSALTVSSGGFSVLYSGGSVRQVRGQASLADFVVSSPYRYEIKFYTNAGPFDPGSGLFPPVGNVSSTITVENPDGASSMNRLQITRNGGEVITYVYHPAFNGWELITGFANGLRKESLERSTNNTQRTEIRIIRDGSDTVLSKVSSLYQTFPWGEELLQTVEDPDGLAHATTYSYYSNSAADGANYGHLRSVVNWTGHWEFYKQYDPIHGLLKSVSQFQNNPYTETSVWPDSANRSSEVVYDGRLETRTEYLKGQAISRSWHNEPTPGYIVDAVATNPSATTWSDASNLSTFTYQYLTSNTNGAMAGKPLQVINPDKTMSVYAYYDEFVPDPTYAGGGTPPQIETLRTATWTGEPNTNFAVVVNGTFTETVTDLLGNQLSTRQFDIATGALLSSETVTARDAFGRPTRINYLDGTYITRGYDCCGLAQETDREGITTTYNTDHTVTLDLDGNGTPETYYGTTVTRAGISTHTLTDALGRDFKTILQGTNGNLIVQDERHYNIFGDLDWSKDAMARTTTYSQTNSGGFTLRTTAFPDAGQSIESTYQDGSAHETRGNAVQGLRYAYDVVQDNGTWVQTSTQTRLENDGTVSPEYTTTYTDFVGRAYKTEYPWPDGNTNVFASRMFNSKGQLARSTDPDGLTMLYASNGRGELETTALDLASPGVIDFGGSDRITRTTSLVENSAQRGTVVRKTVTELWETNGSPQSTVLQINETSADGTQTWSTQWGLTTHTTTVIDRANQRRTVTTGNPDGTSAVTIFEQGRQKSVTRFDKNGARVTQTTFAYDSFGRLQTQTDARNGPTTYSYYDDGQIHTVTTPDPDPTASGPGLDPQTTSYTYYRDPANGIKTLTTLPDGGVVTQEYFPSGQLKKTWGARTYPSEYTYDRAGRMAALTTWQQFNFSTGMGISGSATTRWNYNARGLLANKRYADNKGPGYTYTAGGKLKTRLWARGVLTTYGYDDKTGDLVTLTYSDATPAVTNAYARSGQLQSVTDASGLRTFGYRHGQTDVEAYEQGLFAGFTLIRDYDDLDRQTALSVSSPTGAVYHVTYGYDAASRLYAVTSGVDVAIYDYHPDSDLVQTLTQAHSNAVRLTTTKLYDKLGRLQSITSVPSADSSISFAYQYNDANQRTRATLANGEYWTYGYDPLGQVTNGVKRFPNGDPIPGYSFGYAFDHIGNRLLAIRDGKSDTYTNNGLNQIASINYAPWLHVLGTVSNNATMTVNGQTPVRSNAYFYAQLPATSVWNTVSIQARSVGQATNGTDALAEETGHLFQPTSLVAFQYDEDGNLTVDSRWVYTWDAQNRLIASQSHTNPPNNQVPILKMRALYDSNSRRISTSRSYSSPPLPSGQTTSAELSLFDRYRIIANWSATEQLQSYTWGLDYTRSPNVAGGIGGVLKIGQPTSPSQFPAFDASGNTVSQVSSVSGSTTARYEYEAFGALLQRVEQKRPSHPLLFSTKQFDSDTETLYFGHRHYSPRLGRWLSKDAFGESGGKNLHAFVNNNAVNHTDFLGFSIVCDCAFASDLKYYNIEYATQAVGGHKSKFSRSSASSLSPPGGNQRALIISRMVDSPSMFTLKGKDYDEQLKNLRDHIDTRLGIVQNAQNKQFRYAGGQTPTPFDLQAAMQDPDAYFNSINNPQTALYCLAATKLIFYAAIGVWDAESQWRSHNGVWIPGDWGYIHNRAREDDPANWEPGLEGENIIHVGTSGATDQFWGHFSPGVTAYSLEEWFNGIRTWPSKDSTAYGRPELDSEVQYPTRGLE
jgi:RHS repeat-associated protein